MADPFVHSKSSVKRWGGKMEDYLKIHEKMDCQKGYMPCARGRALTHTSFWVMEVMVPLFGRFITNSDGREVPVKDICFQHINEDYRNKFIPTAQDFIENMTLQPWMNNGMGEKPNSCKGVS